LRLFASLTQGSEVVLCGRKKKAPKVIFQLTNEATLYINNIRIASYLSQDKEKKA